MPRKTNLEKLQDAIAANDTEAVAILVEKVRKQIKTTTPKNTKKKQVKTVPKKREYQEIPILQLPTQQPQSGVRIQARSEPVRVDPKFNLFKDTRANVGIEKIDKQLAKQAASDRPGTSASARPIVKKIKATCLGCHQVFEIYESELTVSYDENTRAQTYYKCDRCIISRR